MHPDEIELLKLQRDCLEEAIRKIAPELVRAGMSEYNPTHAEMLEMGKWALGLLDLLGLNEE